MTRLLSFLLAVLLIPVYTQAQDKVSIVLNWFPEMEHGGFYAAQVHGYYTEANLAVEIVPGGVDVPVGPRVATGRNTFGVTNADNIVFARAAEANIVALMAPMQVSPRCIMVHADQGINGFADLNDMTLAMNPKDAFAEFLKTSFPMKNLKIVPYPGSVAPFLSDKRFGQQAYSISEPFVAKKNGGNPKVLMLADAGWNPYTSCLVTSDEYLKANPDVVRRVVAASVKGWEKYMKEPAETNKHITKLNPEMGADILEFGVGEMQSMVYTDKEKKAGLGTMTDERWKTLLAQMEKMKQVKPGQVKPSACYTTQFLK